eukprot:COSAG02_NODE_7605_length_2937_cov_2.178999_4_plen_110_part_00
MMAWMEAVQNISQCTAHFSIGRRDSEIVARGTKYNLDEDGTGSLDREEFRVTVTEVLNVLLFRPVAATPRPLCRQSTSQAPTHPVTYTRARDTHATQTVVGAQIRSDTW